jgi:hypothetical protein
MPSDTASRVIGFRLVIDQISNYTFRRIEFSRVLFSLLLSRRKPMKQSEQFITNAEHCAHLAEQAQDEPSKLRFRRMEAAWLALAQEQDWLDGGIAPARIAVHNVYKEGKPLPTN